LSYGHLKSIRMVPGLGPIIPYNFISYNFLR